MRMIKIKIFNLIVIVLLTILFILSYIAINAYASNRNKGIIQANKLQTNKEMTLISKEEITKKLNSENSLNCLSGEDEVKARFSNESISDDDTNISWIKKKLAEWNSKELVADATFKFSFAYSLENIDKNITVQGDIITINLSLNRLSLVQCELIEDKSLFAENVGWLQSKFEPQELNSLNKRIKDSARNTIQSDSSKREQAIENVKSDMKNLLEDVVNKNTTINFNISDYDVVEQDDVEIIK